VACQFDRHLGNSLFAGLVSTVITLVLGCMAAYGLARFRFRGRSTIAYTTLLLRTVPLAVLAIPVFMIWSELPVAASLFITDIGVDWGRVMGMGSLIAIPPLIFTFVAARQIITGLTAGAVKG
jgi:ABC-type glycerol-3-phosphate transport system permease component